MHAVGQKSLFLISAHLVCLGQTVSSSAASQEICYVAKKYARAILQRDYKTSAALMHSDALNTIRSSFVEGLEKARKQNVEKDYLAAFGVKESADELLRLSASKLCVVLNRKNQTKGPSDQEFTHQTKIEISSVTQQTPEHAIVRIKLLPPLNDADLSFFVGFELKQDQGKWRVLRDVPELGTQPKGLTSHTTGPNRLAIGPVTSER